MIVLNLRCNNEHRFEGWFASREAFDDQCTRGLVECPHCQSSVVTQLPSAPRIARSTEVVPAQGVPSAEEVARRLHAALTTMARQAENVGERFPEEARRMHYEETPARAIRGVASAEETRDLLEEGIAILPAPVPPDEDLH